MSSFWNIIIIFGAALTAIALLFFIRPKDGKKIKAIIIKVCAVVFGFVATLRLCMPDSFLYVINGGFYEGIYYSQTDVLQSILRWGLYISSAVSIVAIFCKNKTFKNISTMFCLPIAALSVFFYGDFINYFMQPGTQIWKGFLFPLWSRHFQFSIELILAIILPLYILLVEKSFPKFKNKKEMINLAIALPVVILTMIPMYIPQSLWGYTNIALKGFSLPSLICLLIVAISCFLAYFVFRFKSYDTRYSVCLFIALASVHMYTSMYLLGHTLSRIPLQLCDLASYLFVICIIFKAKRLFDFCILANVLGTLIAMFEPDTASSLFSAWSFHFAMEHIWVLVVPITFLSLRMFPKLTKVSLKNCAIFFSIYFLVCAVSGTIINGFSVETGIKVNYFYLFNDRVLDVLTFMRWTRALYWKIGRFDVFPVYLVLFYAVYYLTCVGVYYAIKFCYKKAEEHFFLRQVRIREWEERTGRKSNRIFDYAEAERRNNAENN